MILRISRVAVLGLLVTVGSVEKTAAQPTNAPSAGPTYSKDVAPILFKNCTSCHRPGEIAPMSLLTYKDVRPWVRSIVSRVTAGTMPPWHADPTTGEFLNDRRLASAEKETLLQWAAAGAPEGDPADLPAPPTYVEGWTIGQPDAILAMQEDYPVPSSGKIASQFLEVPTNFPEDRWVQAFEVRPGNRTVVHHVIVYMRPPAPPAREQPERAGEPRRRPAPLFTFAEGMDIPAGQTGGPELPEDQRPEPGPNDRSRPPMLGPSIGAYVPGNPSRMYQPGTAARLIAGSTLVFQMHYSTTGTPTTDRTSIGFLFTKERPKTELRSAALINGSLHIPAGDPDYRVDAEMTINRDMTLWGMLPHTHVRGKRWTYEAEFQDGRKETILSVPKYDFEWQTDYVFRTPLKLPKGTKLHATAWYDNSPANKSNPDPTQEVWWGDQTWEEMMFTGLTFSVEPAQTASTSGQ